ncbi:hypothetical protein J6590_075698 [Homalodisca vitripennis]|nr:hypothetical protein J6590_075698 [Homalodisca vitripennis]
MTSETSDDLNLEARVQLCQLLESLAGDDYWHVCGVVPASAAQDAVSSLKFTHHEYAATLEASAMVILGLIAMRYFSLPCSK